MARPDTAKKLAKHGKIIRQLMNKIIADRTKVAKHKAEMRRIAARSWRDQ